MPASSPPSKQQRLWQRGEQHVAQRQWQQAAENFLAIVEHDRSHAPAWLKAADCLLLLDRYRLARQCALAATADHLRFPELRLQIARRLRQFNEPQALFALAHDMLVDDGNRTLTDAGMLVSAAGDQALARDMALRALALDAGNPATHYLRGLVASFEGDTADATTALENAIHAAPDFAQAHWLLSSLRTASTDDNHVARLRESQARVQPGSNAEAYLCFALHNELHALRQFDEAWQALRRGCAVKRQLTSYDQRQSLDLFTQIKAACTAEFVAPVARSHDITPIFIVGMHRSGTTLLERILGGHSRVADGGESYAFSAQLALACDHEILGALDAVAVERLGDADFGAIGAGFIDASCWRTRGKPCFTEKLPPNFLNAGYIAKALPGARILHLVRDPADTCFSNLRTYFGRAAAHSFDQLELADYYAGYRDLMRHWHAVMPGRVLDISYDALVSDTETTMRQVFGFCGLPFEARALEVQRSDGTVATASHGQVRQGILRNRGGAWRPYAQHLQPMLGRLGALGCAAP